MLTSLKRNSTFIIIGIILFACNNPVKKKNAGLHPIINIGHAGSGFNYLINPFNPYPTNGFMSFKKALENGADGIEMDLQISADSVLVLFHNLTLDDNTDLKGLICEHSSKDVIGQPYRCGFPYDFFQNDSIITFKKWITYAVTLNTIPYIHIDSHITSGCPLKKIMLQKMNDEIREVNYPLEKIIIISTDAEVCDIVKENYQGLKVALEEDNFERGLNFIIKKKYDYLSMDFKYLDKQKVERAHLNNIGVIVSGGKSGKSIKQIVEMQPDFIETNNVRRLYSVLNN